MPERLQESGTHWIASTDHAEEIAWTEAHAQKYRDAGWSVWGPFEPAEQHAEEIDRLSSELRQWQAAAARASREIIAADEKIDALREALREAIGWSYGEDVTPERRDELEQLRDAS